ncbi:hypothetical protein O3M35_008331 [Rhynocoris fuscipes]
MRPTSRTDVLVYVLPDRPEDLKTLRLRLSCEDGPETLVSLIKLSDYKPSQNGYSLSSVPVLLPPLPADGKTYILQMETSLSQSTHEYTLRPIHFKASGYSKVIRIPFSPRIKSRDADLSQSSYLLLPFLMAIGLAFYKKEKVQTMLNSALDRARASHQPTQHSSSSYDSSSETFLSEHPKKKYKSRKT